MTSTTPSVHAGPFFGLVAAQYDVVDGRFRLRVGEYRDRATGLSQKIPWFLPLHYRVGTALHVSGRRLTGPHRRFRQTFPEAYTEETTDPHVFPSVIKPPAEGCWRLTFRTGRITARLTVLVRGRG
jgi:hypothetical protein